MIVGLDVHKKETVGFVVNGNPNSDEWFTIPTTNEGLTNALGRLEGHKVLIEASTSGKAVARFLRNRGIDVDLVQADVLTGHIRYTKTDKLDAKDLARIGALGGYKTCYIPTADEEEVRSLVRHVRDLREHKTRIKNQAKAILQRNLVPEPPGNLKNDSTRKRWKRLPLPASERAALASKLDVLARLDVEDEEAMLALCTLVHDDPNVAMYMTMPGVNVYTASAVAGFCGDMTRFPDASKIAAYSGLVPRVYQSGAVSRGGNVTKRGPNVLRFALVEAVQQAVRHPGRLKNKYNRLAPRIGKGKAFVAVARTLIMTLWSMAVRGKPYEGHNPQLAQAKTWRLGALARLKHDGHVDAAKRLLATSDVKRAHGAWLRGTSKTVPAP